MTSSPSNNNTEPHSRTDHNADANHAPAKQDASATAVFDNDRVSAQQVEGLTDTDELSKQIAQNAQKFDKSPENALNEQGAEKQSATEHNDGSAGNQTIRNAVENLNENALEGNLLHQDKDSKQGKDSDTANQAPFSPD